jgi:hypothetical protein
MRHHARACAVVALVVIACAMGCYRRPAASTQGSTSGIGIPLNLPPCDEPDQNPSGEEYIPAGQMIGVGELTSDERDRQSRAYFSVSLRGLGEPTMLGRREGESYRLLVDLDPWQRLAIRVEPGLIHVGSVERLPSKPLKEGETQAPPIEFGPRGCRSRLLLPTEWAAIRGCFEKTSFWTVPTGRPPWHTFDATTLIVEAQQQERYHFVVRFSPWGLPHSHPSGEPFMRCADLLVGLAGLEGEKR